MKPDPHEARLRGLEARVARGDALDDAAADWLVGRIQRAVLRARPVGVAPQPSLRSTELDPTLTRLLTALLSAPEHTFSILRELSLPSSRRSLAAFLGRGPAEGLDREITLEGFGTASILTFARESVAGLLPPGVVLDAIAALGPAALEETLEQIVSERGHVLTKVAQRDDPLVFLRALTDRLGAAGSEVLVGVLARNEGNKLLAIRAWAGTNPTSLPQVIADILDTWASGPPPMRAAAAPVIASVHAALARAQARPQGA